MVERIRRPHRLLLKPPQRPSIGRIMWRSSDADWGDGQRRWRSREGPVSNRSASASCYPTSSLAVWVMQNVLVPQRRIRVRYVTVTKMRGYSCTAEVPSRVGQCGRGKFPSRFHLPYPDRDHTSKSLLAARLSTITLEPIAQQLISLITDYVR